MRIEENENLFSEISIFGKKGKWTKRDDIFVSNWTQQIQQNKKSQPTQTRQNQND